MRLHSVLAVSLAALLVACTHYMTATNFHSSLKKGMSREAFMAAWQEKSAAIVGGSPSSSRAFTLDGDAWEVLIYSVYEPASVSAGYPRVGHREFVAFKNGRLEEWGVGTLPLSLKTNPTVVNFESAR